MKVLSGVRLFQSPRTRAVPSPQWRIPEVQQLSTVEAQHRTRQSNIPQGRSHCHTVTHSGSTHHIFFCSGGGVRHSARQQCWRQLRISS